MEAIYFTKEKEYNEAEFEKIKNFIEEQIQAMSIFQSTQTEVVDEIIDRIFTYKFK